MAGWKAGRIAPLFHLTIDEHRHYKTGDRNGPLVEQHGDYTTLCEPTSALGLSFGFADPLMGLRILRQQADPAPMSAGASNQTAFLVRSKASV